MDAQIADLRQVTSHTAPSAPTEPRRLPDLVAEVDEARCSKWDATLHAGELLLDSSLRLPDGIALSENALKSLARLTDVPSTVVGWCRERGYESHVATYVNDHLKAVTWEDSRTGRPPTRYFARFRQSLLGETYCRGLFTGQYGVLDNHDALSVLSLTLDAADLRDVEVRRVEHDGDSLSATILVPDYAVEMPDSEYHVGIELANSEVDGPFTVTGLVYRTVCSNGMLLGVRKGAEYSRRHVGCIDLAEVAASVQAAVRDALGTGRESLQAHRDAWEVRVREPKRLIAHLGKSSRLSREQSAAWLKGYEATIREPRSPEGTLGSVLNGLTRAARDAEPWERRAMESEAGRMLAPGIGMALGDLERRWSLAEERAREVKDEEVERLLAV